MSKKQKEALGKGIRALLQNMDEEEKSGAKKPSNKSNYPSHGEVLLIPIEKIEVNPFQPRNEFDNDKLIELSNSIKIHGVVQPITVRQLNKDKFQLIAGERRLRASKLAKLDEIPAYIRTANDQESLEIALIENIQREDLNALEIGINYQRLLDECELTHEELSKRLGKSRSSITNFLRLLKLPPDVQKGVREKLITMGHARAIAGIDDVSVQLSVFKTVVEKSLSVRKTEDLIKQLNKGSSRKVTTSNKKLPYPFQKLQDRLSSELSTKVSIKPKKNNSGEIVVYYHNDDDLERLTDIMTND